MNTRIITLVAVAAALVACTSDASAKSRKDRDEEGIGVGVGGIAGAILGGPIGFIIGGAAGGMLGHKIDKEMDARDAYEAKYEQADALASSLQEVVSEGQSEVQNLRLVMSRQEKTYRDALAQAFDVEVYFHTGEATLDEAVAGKVERMGEILNGFDDFAIVVEGHADPRGEESYNENLSADRAAAVREALIRSGLPEDKITTRALGETDSRAADGDLDAMALERRVDLSVVFPLPRENRVAQQ